MWEIYPGWESIVSVPLEDATGYLLEFADEPMLLVRQGEGYSIDSELESSVLQGDTGIQLSGLEQQQES